MAKPLTFIITLSLILAIAFSVVDANIDPLHARHQVSHRILKKRAPAPQKDLLGIDNAAAGGNARVVQNAATPTPGGGDASQVGRPNPVSTALGDPPTPVPQPVETQITPVLSNAPPTITDPPGGLAGGLLGNSSLALLSTLSSVSPTSLSSSTTSLSSDSLTSSTPTSSPTVDPQTVSEVTVTSSSTQSPSPTADTSGHSVTKLQRNTIIILIAIGASIGAAGLIWTVIRKWKFRPSSSFEDRMQPIDWQPTTGGIGDRDITEKLHRSGSTASHGSFTSGNNHDNLADLPQHDFTAGAANLAPVGGYADLQRGPSPLPDVHAGPTYNYDIPNPHGTYYNNNAGGHQGGYDHRGY